MNENCRVVGMGSKLVGCGSAIPALSISNDNLSKIVETSDEWIATRTGIRNRRVLSGKYVSGLFLIPSIKQSNQVRTQDSCVPQIEYVQLMFVVIHFWLSDN